MDIQVGEYVRTIKGTIAKIKDEEFDLCTRIPDGKVLYKKWVDNFLGSYMVREEIVKHSFNILDLIEKGDYVNGLEVDDFDYEDGTLPAIPVYTPDGLFNTIECYVPLEELDIKTIATKEQFKSVEYEV